MENDIKIRYDVPVPKGRQWDNILSDLKPGGSITFNNSNDSVSMIRAMIRRGIEYTSKANFEDKTWTVWRIK